MAIFLLSVFISALLIISKMVFWIGESEYSLSVVGMIDIISVVSVFIVGIYSYFKTNIFFQKKKLKDIKNISTKIISSQILYILILIPILLVFYANYSKETMHWDSLALYDARAVFLESGIPFSKMPSLSIYDNLNQYYYLLYPPYTSIGHYLWRVTGLIDLLPVSTYYSVYFTLLALSVYFVAKHRLSVKLASMVTFFVVWNGSILNISLKEYTNLPYTLHMVLGIFLLYLYLKERKTWQLCFGGLLISTSIWIRLLEPMWLSVVVALLISTIIKENKFTKFIPAIFLFILCLTQFLSWEYFTKVVAQNPGFLTFSAMYIFEPIFGVFTGVPLRVAMVVARNWGFPLLIHFSVLILVLLRIKHTIKDIGILFLSLVVAISIGIYMFQFYFISFQFDWWSIVAMSLDRSSTFLIPVSTFILILIWEVISKNIRSS